MEVAIIDWKSIDSRFVKDDLYEHINAPKWADLKGPDDPVDDEAWFCRPSCNHPKTAEDFYKENARTPISNSKLQKSSSVSSIPPLGDRNKREATLKKRGIAQPFAISSNDVKYNVPLDDSENQDPNFSTPPIHKAKAWKEAFKSSTEKKQTNDTVMRNEQVPKLKSTLSARNLFSGGDLLNKMAEFCNELKKLATRPREKENAEDGKMKDLKEEDANGDYSSGELNDRGKERKPLLELNKEKSESTELTGSKGKPIRKKRNDNAENTPISVDVKNIKHQEADASLQIRTCPPTPQCFSANRAPFRTMTPKALNSRTPEKSILQELKQTKKEENKALREDKSNNHGGGDAADRAARAAAALDVFWFLKPCTLSN